MKGKENVTIRKRGMLRGREKRNRLLEKEDILVEKVFERVVGKIGKNRYRKSKETWNMRK